VSIQNYLKGKPFLEIQRYKSTPPQDAVAYVGTPRKHPYEDDKLLLVGDPASDNPGVYEFLVGDIVAAEDLASPVMENGESYSKVRIWIRRGSMGMRHEPFEVDTPPHFFGVTPDLKLTKTQNSAHSGAFDGLRA
jgi:hypothetical protein